jgi:imidazolonepropionase-like amidohydrolase
MPRAWVSAVLIALLVVTAAGQQPAGRTLLVRHVTLIDGSGGTPQVDVTLLVRSGRIAEIIPSASAASASADLTLNGQGLFAIPGLIDAHVHLSPSPMPQRLEELRETLHGGVTGVFDLAGDVRQTADLARMALAGDIESPVIFYAALFAGPEFFKDPRVVASSLGFRPGDAPWAREITPATDLVRAVAAARGTGATALKLYAALDAGAVRRIADEARHQEMRLIAHATVFPAKPSDLVAAGVHMLAHAAYLVWEGSPASTDFTKRASGDFAHVPANSPEIERLLMSMHDKDAALNPTLWIFAEGPAGRDAVSQLRTPWMNAVTRRAAELGVSIAAGTDNMFDPARDRLPILHRELEALVAGAGLTPMQALVAATRNAARAIGVERVRGMLEPGKSAEHVHRTIHLQGDEKDLDGIARATLGVGLQEIKGAFTK